eukprot:scaffold243901_cov31-Tisochrysis_lutea.AAC.1
MPPSRSRLRQASHSQSVHEDAPGTATGSDNESVYARASGGGEIVERLQLASCERAGASRHSRML